MYAYLTSRTHGDSVPVNASGAFSIPVADAHCGPLLLRIDAPGGVERRYHRALIRLGTAERSPFSRPRATRADSAPGLRILLVPTQVVVDGGSFAGATVPIHIDAALAMPTERSRYWRVARASPDDYGTPIGWPEGMFPIPVALRGRSGVSASDSAAFWRAARQLEADLGRSLFQPVNDEPAPEEIWRIIVSIDARAGSPGLTFITYDAAGEIYEATVAIRSSVFLSDARLVTHELIHALGFGHATAWYSATGSAYSAPARATVADVAYAQLFYRLRRAHIAHGVTHGVTASAAEARALITGDATRCAP